MLPRYGREPEGSRTPVAFPGYRSTGLRAPLRTPVDLPHRLTEVTGPVLGEDRVTATDADLTLREWFTGCATARGMDVERDRNGNLWAWWLPHGWTGDPTGAFVTGSHLDSVPDGGAFDGPLGVASAFAAIDALRADGVRPRIPVGVVAFADEEGARFGVACVGSQLSTGALDPDRARALRDGDGLVLMAEVASGKVVPVAPPRGSAITSLAWNATGTRLAFGTEAGLAGFVDLSKR